MCDKHEHLITGKIIYTKISDGLAKVLEFQLANWKLAGAIPTLTV